MAQNSWDKLCQTKRDRGLGFRKTKEVNMALIAKLSWMVASNSYSICMELLRKKCKVGRDWLSKEPMKTASPIWRAIEKTKKIVLKGACYMVVVGILLTSGRILGSHGQKISNQSQRMTQSNSTHRQCQVSKTKTHINGG